MQESTGSLFVVELYQRDKDNVVESSLCMIDDLVNYEAKRPIELKKYFTLAVEDYIKTCEEIGRKL
jgi:predicted HicB family RNase H-like nuclease